MDRLKQTLMLLAVGVSFLHAEVTVRVEPMTFTLETAESGARGSKPGKVKPGNYRIKGTEKEIQDTVDVIKLNNGMIEAWVCPAYAGRLLRVQDLKTGADYFHWMDRFQDMLAWQTGGMKASFPFFEHGTFLRQPAGYRIVTNDDGSVTVAMDQRFSHHTTKADVERYGRYSDEALNILITVFPGSTAVEWRQRKENLNPTPRSQRCWNVVLFPQEKFTKDGFKTKRVRDPETGKKVKKQVPAQVADQEKMREQTEFIYPAPWVTDHGPSRMHTAPHWSQWTEDGPADNVNWNVSHFALFTPFGFSGAWYPKDQTNRLRIHTPDRDKGPGLKLYSAYWPDFMEFWGGQGIVFEAPSPARPGYVPVDFQHWFWITQGMGKVAYANRHVAVSVEGDRFELMASRNAVAKVVDATGATVAEGPVGPHTLLKGSFQKGLKVWLDGESVLDQTLPIEMPIPGKERELMLNETNAHQIPKEVLRDFEFIVEQRNPKRPGYWEEESFAHNEGMTRLRDVRKAAASMEKGDAAVVVSMARAVYRLGDLAEAERLARMAKGPEADFLLGLIAWENGEKVNFRKAGAESGYHRALLAIQNNDAERAVKEVDRLLAETPEAWLPQLARAFWSRNPDHAEELAKANPASPEAQLVLKMLGRPNELRKLLKDNPSAREHVELFEDSLINGTWKHIPRFPMQNL